MKRFFQSKKADGDASVVFSKWIYYLIAIVLLAYGLLSFAGGGFSFVQSQASTPIHLEEDILVAQLVNTCFVYEEEEGQFAGRTTQNIVDFRKFTDLHLDDCVLDDVEVRLSSLDDSFPRRQATSGVPRNNFETTRYVLVQTPTGLSSGLIQVIT